MSRVLFVSEVSSSVCLFIDKAIPWNHNTYNGEKEVDDPYLCLQGEKLCTLDKKNIDCSILLFVLLKLKVFVVLYGCILYAKWFKHFLWP